MNTTNLISTPNINGNIGSCKSEVITVSDGRTYWTTLSHDVVTNSCTGEVIDYPQTWTASGMGLMTILVPLCIFSLIVGAMLDN